MHMMVMMPMVVMPMMMPMMMVVHRRFGGHRRGSGRSAGCCFLCEGVSGEAEAESGRSDKALDHETISFC